MPIGFYRHLLFVIPVKLITFLQVPIAQAEISKTDDKALTRFVLALVQVSSMHKRLGTGQSLKFEKRVVLAAFVVDEIDKPPDSKLIDAQLLQNLTVAASNTPPSSDQADAYPFACSKRESLIGLGLCPSSKGLVPLDDKQGRLNRNRHTVVGNKTEPINLSIPIGNITSECEQTSCRQGLRPRWPALAQQQNIVKPWLAKVCDTRPITFCKVMLPV
ncbi:MAG: hypothetical protein WC782_16655 [Methylococcaceae bacterium]|jgi:hypothetical protein